MFKLLRRNPRFVHAWGPWSWFLKRNDFIAIPMPWGTVYCLPEYIDDPIMRGHERVHFEQMDREGTLRFIVKYLCFAWKHGYRENPFEVEAYARFDWPNAD